jgi:hypothetical protein
MKYMPITGKPACIPAALNWRADSRTGAQLANQSEFRRREFDGGREPPPAF